MNEQEILNLKERIKELESQVVDLQSQQLETGNNIVTLIQHAETMNNVTDASGPVSYTHLRAHET